MRYIVIDRRRDGTGDEFDDEFNEKAEAIKAAERDWHYLTPMERKERTIFVLDSVNPDEEDEAAWNHLDGNPIWEDGEEVNYEI